MLHMYAFITSHIAGLQTKRDERGATAVEYGLMVALIAVVIILAVTAIGTNLSAKFNEIATAIANAGGGA